MAGFRVHFSAAASCRALPALLISLSALSLPAPARAGLSVPVDVSNWAAAARMREPVTAGLPLPAGAVTDLARLRLFDESGRAVPLQARALSRWWNEKHAGGKASPSAKWVLLDFQADIRPRDKVRYYLKDDPAAPAPRPPALDVRDAEDGITITTGPLRFMVPKKRFRLFDSLWLDLDGDGKFAEGERLVSGGSGTARITAGDWREGGARDGVEHLSSLAAPERVVVEERGPLKVVVRAEGRHHAPSGGVARGLYGYQVFLTAYAGSAYVDVQWALTNTLLEGDRPAAGPNPYTVHAWPFREYRLDLDFNLGPTQTRVLLGADEKAGAAGDAPAVLSQTRSGFTLTGGPSGTEAKGAAALGDGRASVLVALRDFAANSPKAIRVSRNRITLDLFPAGASPYWLDPFSRKNQRMRLHFKKGPAAPGELSALWNAADAPLRLLADRDWYVTTRAWDKGFGIPPAPQYARRIIPEWTRLPKPASAGWEKYGELDDFNSGGTHWNFNTCFWKYLLTGNPADFEEAESRTFYFNDIVSLHTSGNRWQDLRFIAQPEDHLGQLTEYETPENHYNAKVKAFPGFAWRRSNLPDAGHMPNVQAYEYYLLTGDPPTKDALESQGIRGAAYVFWRTYGPFSGWRYSDHKGKKVDPERFFVMPYGPRYIARPGIVCTHAYEVTGDERYLYPAKLAAYSLRNFVRRSPIGYMADVNYDGYLQDAAAYWGAARPGQPMPSYRSGSDFQIGIGNQALATYWNATGDEEIRDAVIHSALGLEWRAGISGGKYTGFSYSGWADYPRLGRRYSEAGLQSSFISTGAEAFSGLIAGYLLSGREDLWKVIEHGRAHHDPAGVLFLEGFNLWEALWRRQALDREPPARVTDLTVAWEGGKLRARWTAPGDGPRGRAAEYQLKFAEAPLVDFVKRWDPAAKTGWPDLNGTPPADAQAYLAREDAYRNTKEIAFWAAANCKGEPKPGERGAAETLLVDHAFKPGAAYRFALVSFDAAGNVSAMSNVASPASGR